jgi:hypothetical protein
MKLQDLHPIDSTTLGLDNVYHTIGANSHYINSECIQTTHKKIITKGKQYLLASTSLQGSDAIVHKIRLLDVYFNKGHVYMFVLDLQTDRVFIVDLCMECPVNKCDWILCDWDELNKLKDYETIKNYCNKCTDTKNKPVAQNNCKHSNNDLLEFEF